MRKKIKIIFFIAIFLTLLVVSLYFYMYSGVISDRKMVDSLMVQNKEKILHLEELQKIESNLKSTLALGNRLSNFLVKEDVIVDFIQEIESLMKLSKITGSVDSVTEELLNDAEVGFKDKSDVVMSVSAKGDWNNLIKFIGLLENLPYKSTVNSLNLKSALVEAPASASKSSSIQKQWEMNLKMYVRTVKIKKENFKMQ